MFAMTVYSSSPVLVCARKLSGTPSSSALVNFTAFFALVTLDSKSVVRPGQFLAHPLDLVALGLGQFQPGPAVVAHRLRQQLGVLALELRLAVGVGLERLIDVLAIINADRPFLQLLERVGGGVAQGGVGAGLLDQRQPVVGQADLVADVVQGAHGVFEGDLAAA